MFSEPYLCLASNEVSNGNRILAYLAWACLPQYHGTFQDCSCPALDNGSVFVDPVTDPAPWYVAGKAESGQFLGLWANAIDIGPVGGRSVTARSGGGASIGTYTPRHRVVTVRGFMFATTAVGMEWGQRWLNEVLAGSCSGCSIDTLEVLPACPPEGDEDRFFRTLYGAGLTEGPVFIPGEDADYVQEVSFTLSVAEPYLFGPPVDCLDEVSVASSGSECCQVSTDDWNGDAALVIELEAGDSGASDVTVELTPFYARRAMRLDGTGDYASTPDNAALDQTGDITLWGLVDPTDSTPAATMHIVGKDLSPNRSYALRWNTTGALGLMWTTDGTTAQFGSSLVAIPGVVAGVPLFVAAYFDVDDGAGNRVIRFYTKPLGGGSAVEQGEDPTGYTLFATDSAAGATSIFSGSARATVGATDGGTNPFQGDILAAGIMSGNWGTAVANPDFSAQDAGTDSFTDDAGRVWTLEGDAAIVEGDCPGEAPPCAVYRVPVMNPDDRLGIDAVRNQVVLHDPTRKTEVAGLQMVETDGLFSFPTVGVCSTVCVCVSNDGAVPVTATVTSQTREV